MFVKKLVEKASKKGGSDGLTDNDVDPHLVFHYGVPHGGTKFAYDRTQRILALSTRDGRIKLFGRDNTQALLESSQAVPSKFLEFIENDGVLLNVTSDNHIEVWDTDKKQLSNVYVSDEEISSFTVVEHSPFMYIGGPTGNISVLKLQREPLQIVKMKYTVPLSAASGNSPEAPERAAVMHILPQPTAEYNRVLIVYQIGHIILWDIHESKSIFKTGCNTLQSLGHETRKVTSACWACPFGSKVVVGYSNGEIFIWSIPPPNRATDSAFESSAQNTPSSKLNLGYKSDNISIGSMKWVYADGKASRLYVMGASENVSSNFLQILLLNEHTESRNIKLGLPLLESCIDMEIISTSNDQSKHKEECFLLLGKSGKIYVYDDGMIEKYLLQCQSKSTPTLPKEMVAKLPFSDSSITVSKFITNNAIMVTPDEEYAMLVKNYPPILPPEVKQKDGTNLLGNFPGFSRVKNLYLTGHSNGAITIWDASSPFFVPVLQIKQQSEDDFSLSGIPVTALYFDCNTPLLVSGDENGTVRIIKFKPEPYTTGNGFISLAGIIEYKLGSTRKGMHIIHSIKVTKINGSVLSMDMEQSSRNFAVGSEQGYVSVIDLEGPTVLYQKHIASEICSGIVSLQFHIGNLHGFEKKIVAVATKDSSVVALDSDTGNNLTTGSIHPKKPSTALFMQILDIKGNSNENTPHKQSLLLLCSEKAVYVYSLAHIIQGVRKVVYKKKYQSSSCSWASTFCSSTDFGLALLLTSGKMELRSLPDLSLIAEISIRGFTNSPSKPNAFSDSKICCSSSGDLVLVNGQQEVLLISVLIQRQIFRSLDLISCLHRSDITLPQEGFAPGSSIHKDKKKGIFSSFIKDITGNKAKHASSAEIEDLKERVNELSVVFASDNFPSHPGENDFQTRDGDEDGIELDIDDIDVDLDGPGEKRKEQSVLSALNKKKLTSTFNAFKGKLKEIKGNNQKLSSKEEHQEEKAGAVDQIKKKYGFSTSNEVGHAKLAHSKLQENVRKLQSINLKTTEMQDSAKSYSTLAKEMLRIAENDKRSS